VARRALPEFFPPFVHDCRRPVANLPRCRAWQPLFVTFCKVMIKPDESISGETMTKQRISWRCL
jgi:hypothetical protein